MALFSFLFYLLCFGFFVLVAQTTRSIIKRFRGRRLNTNIDAERVLRGILPASAIGALLFPASNIAADLTCEFYENWPTANIFREVALNIATVEIFFLLSAAAWAFGIVAVLPIWKVLYRCGFGGPFAAAMLGACASLAVVIMVPRLQDFAFFLLTDLWFFMVVAFAGACSGTMIWWAGFHPERVPAFLHPRPIRSADSESGD